MILRHIFFLQGNSKATLAQKKQNLDNFVIWWLGQPENEEFDDLLKNKDELKFALVHYLESYRVKEKSSGEMIRPKTNTLNKMKSMLVCELSRLSGKFIFEEIFENYPNF